MLNSVTAINHRGVRVRMDLRDPEHSGFLISNITGIGPPEADINITDLAAIDGGYFNSARATTRNIVMSVIFIDDTSVETVRHKSYRLFPVKKPITLIFETDERTCGINGYVESNTPEIFSSQESMQVSIICPYPYFYDAYGDSETKVTFSSSSAAFEFEWSNEITQDEYDNMVTDSAGYHTNWRHTLFGIISVDRQKNIIYDGEADAGMLIEIIASGTVTGATIYNAETGESMKLNLTLAAGDTVYINTVRGSKYARRLRNGNYTNVLNYVDRDASWLTLVNGDNIIGFTADSGVDNLTITVSYQTLYEGV